MTKPPILFAARFPERLWRLAAERFDVLGPLEHSHPDAITPAMRGARALVTMGTLRTDAALLAALPELGLVSCYGSGFEGVDREAARGRGLAVTHGPGANASAVADMALALVLAATRNLLQGDAVVRSGGWRGNAAGRQVLVPGLAGRKVGIYGLGTIGLKIAARAASFETEVAYHNRRARSDVAYTHHPTLLGLAEWAEILVVSVRADAGTRHSVDRAVLSALGPRGTVVNISRGSVIDEEGLIGALETGMIAAAGLDVYEHEPDVPERLRALPNVVLTPHIAGSTEGAQAAMQDLLLSNLDAFFAGRPLVTPVPG